MTCAKLGTCTETSVTKVLTAYTCPIYTPVVEPVYEARWDTIQKYGRAGVEAMVSRPMHPDDDELEREETDDEFA